ncbi:MAG TPA: endonuclease/exonuclease/phosphatase family protein [Terricaulis sp.]|nr:endonuclease/exonuclease/phosphatase family protein [Terricaulis sp.]
MLRRFAFLAAAVFAAGCVAPRQEASPLRLAAWNLEHLAEADSSGCKPRTEADHAALRAYVEHLDADVIAFQEVESAAAAARVFDPGRYQIIIEERQGGGARLECRGLPGHFLNRQATGFAIRRGIAFERHADFVALQLGDANLRSAVDITLRPSGQEPVRLLSVHLKSGCAAGESAEACAVLRQQIQVLEGWIDARDAGERFAVLGDFNRRLSLAEDSLWAELNDGDPQPLRLASGLQGPQCDPRFSTFIDYIVTADLGSPWAFREWLFDGENLSDHCAVSVDIQIN